MIERDDELARALGDLPVPDHAPDFWHRLERGLDDPAGVPTGSAAGAGARGGGTTDERIAVGGVDGGGTDPTVVPLQPRRGSVGGAGAGAGGGAGADRGRRRGGGRGRALLAAAAVVAVVGGGAAVISQLDDGGDQVVTVAEDPASTTSAVGTLEAPTDGTGAGPATGDPATGPPLAGVAGDPTRLGPIEQVGPGLVVGALPTAGDRTTILVRDVLPGDEVGCEGGPLEGLQALAADGSPRPVLSAEGTAIVNGADVHTSPARDRVAVVSRCEGYLGQLLVGVVGADGLPADLQVVAGSQADGSPVPGGPDAEAMPSITWTPDGDRLLVTTARSSATATDRQLWSYQVSTGRWSERTDAPEGVVAAVERRDGTLVAITEAALVVGGEARPRRGVNALALGPDGETVAAYGSEGLLLVDGSGRAELLALGQVGRARFLPDGSHVVLSRYSESADRNEIATVPAVLDGDEPSAAGTDQDGAAVLGATVWGWFEVLPDASGLLVTVGGDVGRDDHGRPAVELWPFATD